jgi:hypothetical protein
MLGLILRLRDETKLIGGDRGHQTVSPGTNPGGSVCTPVD